MDVNSWIKFRLDNNSFCASLGRSLCHGNEHHGIDPNILSSGHHESWLFHKGYLSLHSCQTAILPHEWLSKPPLTLETIQHLRFTFAFWTFGVLGIMGYRTGILRLEFLAFLSAMRIEIKIEKEGCRVSLFRFPIALQGFGISWPAI